MCFDARKLRCVLRIIILLEVDSVRLNAKVMEGTYEGGLENINILHSIHDPLDAMETADTIWCDASKGLAETK